MLYTYDFICKIFTPALLMGNFGSLGMVLFCTHFAPILAGFGWLGCAYSTEALKNQHLGLWYSIEVIAAFYETYNSLLQ